MDRQIETAGVPDSLAPTNRSRRIVAKKSVGYVVKRYKRRKNYDNCIINVDGTNEVCFDTPSTREVDSEWTPDGKILFSSYEYDETLSDRFVTMPTVGIMDSDGTNTKRVTSFIDSMEETYFDIYE